MKSLACIAAMLILVQTSMAGETLPSGRYLPDGTFQPRNLHATLPDPQEASLNSNTSLTPFDEIISVDWEPEIQLYFDRYQCFRTKIFKDPLGIIHAITNEFHLNDLTFYTRSLDGGSTWEDGRLLMDSSQVPAMYNAHILGDADTLSIVYSNLAYTYTLISADHGLSWSPWNQHYTWMGGHVSLKERNGIYFMAVGDAEMARTYLTTSSNHGLNWSSDLSYINNTHWGYISLGINNSGMHLVQEGSEEEVYYTHKLDGDTSWTPMTRISGDNPANSFFPSLVAWGDSNVAALWCDYQNSPYSWTGDIHLRRSTNSGLSWLPIQSLTEDHLSLGHIAIAHGCSLFVVLDQVVLGESPEVKKLFLTYSTDNGASWSPLERIMSSTSLSRDASLLISGDTIHMAFVDERFTPNYGVLFYKRGYLRPEVGINERPVELPDEISISAYPNPFNSSIVIKYNLVSREPALLTIYNIGGQIIRRFDINNPTAGAGAIIWNGTDIKGEKLNSGIYIAELRSGSISKSTKMVFLK